MLQKLRAIWKIIIADQYKVYTYRFSRVPENSECMSADYASYTFSNNIDAVNKYIKDYKLK